MTTRPTPARDDHDHDDHDHDGNDDPQLRMIDDYFNGIGRGHGRGRRPLAQFYTAPPTAVMLSEIVAAAGPWDDAPASAASYNTNYARIIDPACGAGVLVLEAARRLHAAHSLPIAECVGRVWICDVDLGAVMTARRVLRSLGAGCEPHAFWGDSMARYCWRLGTIDLDPLDLDATNRAGGRLYQESVRDWPAESALSWIAARLDPTADNPDPDPFCPLGTAHIDRDGEPTFEWDADARTYRKPTEVDGTCAKADGPAPRQEVLAP